MPFVAVLLGGMALVLLLATMIRHPVAARVEGVLKPFLSGVLILAFCVGLLAMSVQLFQTPGPALALLFLITLGMLAFTWLRDFAHLMSQPDHAFPGRYDKLIWAALLIFLPPVGLLAYWSYRRAEQPEPRSFKTQPTSRDWL
jgi:hypothetical protein